MRWIITGRDLNGSPFPPESERLCSKFPKYTGGSIIHITFAMLNGINSAIPALGSFSYTSFFGLRSEPGPSGGELSMRWMFRVQVIESALRSTGAGWGENMGMYGSSTSTYVKYFTDSLWAKPITSIGGTGMLIYPGCKFVLYGVRA